MTDLAAFRAFVKAEDPNASAAMEATMTFEQQDWVTIFKKDNSNEGGELRIACFLRPDGVPAALAQPGFNIGPGDGRPGVAGSSDGAGGWEIEYLTVGAENEVPLVFDRYFDGPFPNVVELAEDFRLFWDLYEDQDNRRFVTTDEIGDVVTVAEWRDDELCVRKQYLRRYQAVRQLALSLQIAVDRRGGDEITHLAATNLDVAEALVRFAYHGGGGLFSDGRPNFTRLLGKRIISPPPIEQSGVWPYEPPAEYESFIIGADDDGNPIIHTCDPDTLADYFGGNPDAPHYLTPVFFERAVLDKYYGDADRYEVGDAYARASSAWGLRMDNALADHVAVFLGDLGADLPRKEQAYWRSYNVPPQGSMSETAIRRSFLGQFCDSDRVEHRFVASYGRLNAAWESRFGWPLYKPLHEAEAHLARSIHVPTNTSFGQFDDQIVKLAKLVVDSLNEEQIARATSQRAADEKGIAKLERLLDELALESEAICAALRRIQGARTRSGAHRKGSDFDLTILLDGTADLPALIAELLENLIGHYDAVAAALAD
jgi:hypothetical protein